LLRHPADGGIPRKDVGGSYRLFCSAEIDADIDFGNTPKGFNQPHPRGEHHA
jgi:hypothetical protein